MLNAVDLGDDIMVAKITSSPGSHGISITRSGLVLGYLRKESSYIDYSSIFTVEKKLVVEVVGRLAMEALAKVEEKLKVMFDIR